MLKRIKVKQGQVSLICDAEQFLSSFRSFFGQVVCPLCVFCPRSNVIDCGMACSPGRLSLTLFTYSTSSASPPDKMRHISIERDSIYSH